MQLSSFLEYFIFITSNCLNEMLHPTQIWLRNNKKKVINNILKDICQKWFEQSNLQNGHLPCLHQSDIPPMP